MSTIDHPPWAPLPSRAAMAQPQRRGRVEAPNMPIVSPHNSEFASSSSNAHDIARVFSTMEDILAANNDIIQRDEVYYPIFKRQDPSQFKTVVKFSKELSLVQVCPLLRWTDYLPSQHRYGKTFGCLVLAPRPFRRPWQYMSCKLPGHPLLYINGRASSNHYSVS